MGDDMYRDSIHIDAVPVLLVVGAVLGVPNRFNNLGLQAALYQAAPAKQMGSAPWPLPDVPLPGRDPRDDTHQVLFGTSAGNQTLHIMAVVMTVVSVGLVVASVR